MTELSAQLRQLLRTHRDVRLLPCEFLDQIPKSSRIGDPHTFCLTGTLTPRKTFTTRL